MQMYKETSLGATPPAFLPQRGQSVATTLWEGKGKEKVSNLREGSRRPKERTGFPAGTDVYLVYSSTY
jgi:hypothetical protein